jgi:hypothetical protein
LPVGFGAALVAVIMGYGPHILKDAMDKLAKAEATGRKSPELNERCREAAFLARPSKRCSLSVSDMADREPRLLSDGEVIDIGGKRFRYIDTPQASRRP